MQTLIWLVPIKSLRLTNLHANLDQSHCLSESLGIDLADWQYKKWVCQWKLWFSKILLEISHLEHMIFVIAFIYQLPLSRNTTYSRMSHSLKSSKFVYSFWATCGDSQTFKSGLVSVCVYGVVTKKTDLGRRLGQCLYNPILQWDYSN